MPVLLLAQGDAKARDLLKKAISARYGFNPPAIESLRMSFKGRARAKVGPITTWVPVDVTASFRFPLQMRWDFQVKAVGVALQNGVEAFDGEQYRRTRGNNSPVLMNDEAAMSSMRRRMWSVAALLLTPLGEHFVKLTSNDDGSVNVINTQLNESVKMILRANNTIERIEVQCVNPDTDRMQTFNVLVSEEQAPINGLMFPAKISAFWDSEPYLEITPSLVESNVQFDSTLFAIAK